MMMGEHGPLIQFIFADSLQLNQKKRERATEGQGSGSKLIVEFVS